MAQITTSAGGIPVVVDLALNPLSFADRPALVAAAFNRYRVRSITFRFKSRLASSYSGRLYMGVSDDADIVATPTTGPQVLALRTSAEVTVWKDMSITYRPMDPEKWYYIRAEGSGGDIRLTQQGAFFVLSDGLALAVNGTAVSAVTPIGEIEADYLYEFSGATLLGT